MIEGAFVFVFGFFVGAIVTVILLFDENKSDEKKGGAK